MEPNRKTVLFGTILLSIMLAAGCNVSRALAPLTKSPPVMTAIPDFLEVTTLMVNPSEVNGGVPTIVTANINNTKTAAEKYFDTIRIDNLSQKSLPTFLFSSEVTIPGGTSRFLSVNAAMTNSGTYQVVWGDATRQRLVNSAPFQWGSRSVDPGQGHIDIPANGFNQVDVVTGKTVSLQQYYGTPVLLNFVNYVFNLVLNDKASAQLLAIKQVKQQRGDFIPVSVFCGCCPVDVLRQFAKQNNFDWPWLLDTEYSIVNKYGIYISAYSYPTLIFIDKAGVIREFSGTSNSAKLDQALSSPVAI